MLCSDENIFNHPFRDPVWFMWKESSWQYIITYLDNIWQTKVLNETSTLEMNHSHSFK